MANRAPPELRDLVNKVGKFIEYWGFKKVHGQIWCYIYLAKEPVDSTTLIRRLNVSKALVSLAIKDLLKYQVIQVAGRGPRRQIYFRSNPDIMKVVSAILENREKKIISDIHDSFKKVRALDCTPDSIDVDSEKLDDLGEMIGLALETLNTMIQLNMNVVAVPPDEEN